MSSKTQQILSRKGGKDIVHTPNNGAEQNPYTDPELVQKIDAIYRMMAQLSTGTTVNIQKTAHPITVPSASKSTCLEEKKEELTKLFESQRTLSYLYQNYIEVNTLGNIAKTTKEHISAQQNLVKNKELELPNSASRALSSIFTQSEKTEKEYNRVQVSSKNILTSSIRTKAAQSKLKELAKQTQEDCISETCFEESDLIRNVCGALKYGGFFEDSDA